MHVELTDREVQMLKALVRGASNEAVARELDRALRTVELYRKVLMRKLGAESAAQLGYKYAKLLESQGKSL